MTDERSASVTKSFDSAWGDSSTPYVAKAASEDRIDEPCMLLITPGHVCKERSKFTP